ncbi:hypothetical protein ACFL2U_00920 [Patescibacteria group bacterium]
MPDLVKNLKTSFKDVFKDKILITLLVIIAVVAVNQVVFSYLLVGRDSASAAAGTLGYTAIGSNDYPVDLALRALGGVEVVGSNTYDRFEHSVVNPDNGYAFLVDGQTPSNISEYRLLETIPYIRTANMLVGDGAVRSVVLDTTPAPNGYIYMGTDAGKIIKYNTGSLTLAGTLDLSGTYTRIVAGVIDIANGFAYFVADDTTIIKIDLSSFTLVDTVTVSSDGNTESAVIDLPDGTAEKGFAYFGRYNSVVKVDIDPSRTFALDSTITLEAGETHLDSMVMDSTNRYLYLGTGVATTPAKVIKIDMGDSVSRIFERIGSLDMPYPLMDLRSAVIDTNQGFAYFTSHFVDPARIAKIDITPSNFAYRGYVTMNPNVTNFDSGFIYNDQIYMAENDADAQLHKTSYSAKGFVKAFSAPYTKNGIQKVAEYGLSGTGSYFTDSVRDVNGNIYYALNNNITKYNPSTGTVVATISTPSLSGGSGLSKSVIDNVNGFAYFSTTGSPPYSKIYKVRLSDFSLVDTLDIEIPYCVTRDMAIDNVSGYIYAFCKRYSGRDSYILKIDIDPSRSFSLVDTLTMYLTNINNNVTAIALDNSDPNPANHFLFVPERTSTSTVHKISIDPANFSYHSNLTISTSDYIDDVQIDAANGFAYFYGSQNGVAKVNIAHPSFSHDATLNIGTNLRKGKIDHSRGFLYIIDSMSIIDVYKIKLSDFTLVGSALALNADETTGQVIDLDLTNSFAYIVNYRGKVVKVNIQDPTFSRDSNTILPQGLSSIYAGIVDRTNNHGFYVASPGSGPAQVIKFDLTTMAILDTITLASDETDFWQAAIIDETNGYVYFATSSSPSKIIKIDTGNLAGRTFERVGALSLTGTQDIYAAAIDMTNPADPYGVFSDSTSPAKVIKVQLFADDTLPVNVAEIDLLVGENYINQLFLDTRDADPANHFAYIGGWVNPAKIVKVSLNPLARIGVLDLNIGENGVYGAEFDETTGYAYIGTAVNPPQIVKLDLNHPTFSRVGAITLPTEERYPNSSEIDYNRGLLYFATDNDPAAITVIRLSDFSRVGAYYLDDYMAYPYVLTLNNNQLSFATGGGNSDYIVKLSSGSFSPSQINGFSVYSHQAGGNLRLGLYDAFKNLIWESNSLTNNVSNGWLTVNVSAGTPNTLSLSDDNYWLGLQTDSTLDTFSYHMVPLGSGQKSNDLYAFGSFPASIASGFTSTIEGFSAYGSVLISSAGGGGASNITSEIVQNVACQSLSSDTIRWSFEDVSNSEIGFRLYGPEGLIWDSGPEVVFDLTYIDETGLQPNTLYEGRYVTLYSASGESAPSNLASCQTLALEDELPSPEITELPEGLEIGDVIQGLNSSEIYLVTSSSQKRLFPTAVVYNSWFVDYTNIKKVSEDTLSQIALGPNMILRPGTWLMKITSDPKVYAVEPNGVIRWLETEAVALSLYGVDWSKRVIDMPDTYFVDYAAGASIAMSQYSTGTLLQYSGTADIYYIENGSRRLVSPQAFTQNSFQERFVITNIDPLKYELTEGSAWPVDYDYTMTMTQKN